jgi:hypothetical protein
MAKENEVTLQWSAKPKRKKRELSVSYVYESLCGGYAVVEVRSLVFKARGGKPKTYWLAYRCSVGGKVLGVERSDRGMCATRHQAEQRCLEHLRRRKEA